MAISVNSKVASKFVDTEQLMSYLENNKSPVPQGYSQVYDRFYSSFGQLVQYLAEKGFHDTLINEIKIQIVPDQKNPINVANLHRLFWDEMNIRVPLTEQTYVVSPFLENEEIKRIYKETTILATILGFQIDEIKKETPISQEQLKRVLEDCQNLAEKHVEILEQMEKEGYFHTSHPYKSLYKALSSSNSKYGMGIASIDSPTFSTDRFLVEFSFLVYSTSFRKLEHFVNDLHAAANELHKKICNMEELLMQKEVIPIRDSKNIPSAKKEEIIYIGNNLKSFM